MYPGGGVVRSTGRLDSSTNGSELLTGTTMGTQLMRVLCA